MVASPLAAGGVAGTTSVPSGTSVTVTATAGFGYAFVSWIENGVFVSALNPYRFTAVSNRQLVATFAATNVSPGAFTLWSDAPLWSTSRAAPMIQLYWTASAGAGLYDLYRNGTLLASALPGSATTFLDEIGLSLGKSYEYEIVARNPAGVQRSNKLPVQLPTNLRPAQPDLTLENNAFVFSPAFITVGDPVTLTLRVLNDGDAPLPASKGRIALRTTGAPSRDVVPQLDAFDISPLAAREGRTITRTIRVNNSPQGQHRLAVVLSAPTGIVEASLANNDVNSATVLEVAAGAGSGPRIITQPTRERTASNGQTVILTVNAEGEGLTYQWFRDGIAIGPATTGRDLTLTATPELSTHFYNVKVTDAFGWSVMSDSAHITVSESTIPGVVWYPATLIGAEGINADWPTVVITHGFQLDAIGSGPPPDWTSPMRDAVRSRLLTPDKANVLVFWWEDAYRLNPIAAASRTASNGSLLAEKLKEKLGESYSRPIHFIGHSFGTVVGAVAISNLRGFQNIQVTILDSPNNLPSRFISIGAEIFFAVTLWQAGYVDNYYGNGIGSIAPLDFPAVGGPLLIADINRLFPGANHGGVHLEYRDKIIMSGQWPTNVNGFQTSTVPSTTSFTTVSLGQFPPFEVITPTNVAGTTPMVSGQIVPGFQLSVPGIQRIALGVAPNSSSGSTTRQAAVEAGLLAEISTDLVVPADAATLEFDFLVDQRGDGAWMSVSFNGDDLVQFRGDAFGGDNFRNLSVPVAALAGRAGLLRIMLWGAGTQPARMTVANFQFKKPAAAAAAARPVIVTPPASQASQGTNVVLSAAGGGASPTYQWSRNGTVLPTANSATLTLNNIQPSNAGIYQVEATTSAGSTVSDVAIFGLTSTSKVIGAGSEVGADIRHSNGNTYDQISLQGPAASVTADLGQVARISYVDITLDIVQVEFSGAGTLSLVIDSSFGPLSPTNYNQPGVLYMKGNPGIVITGANETTNVSVFSVGKANAVNQSLFRDDVKYDGVADIAFIAISSANGKFGGLRTSNAGYYATKGLVGIYAPNVEFAGPVFVGDISAFDQATPVFVLGKGSDVRVTGGSLTQSNARAVQVSGITQLRFVDGSTSHGTILRAQVNRARLEQNGTDVTSQIVVNPSP
ncbi:MAG: immunoglobulin domain-containing protein [Opitutaceae bacterium]